MNNYSKEQRDELETLMAGASLDALSSEDAARLQHYLHQDPALEAEFVEYLECASAWAETVSPITPPQRLRRNILQITQVQPSPMVWRNTLPNLNWRTLVIAGLMGLVAVIGTTNLSLRSRLQLAEYKLNSLHEKDTHIHVLSGENQDRVATGTVLLDTAVNRATLSLQNIPPLRPGQVYAMWAELEGKTVLCGHFKGDRDRRVVEVITIPPKIYDNADEFTLLITIESSTTVISPSTDLLMKTKFEI